MVLKNVRCWLGRHSWSGCVCDACGKLRDSEHSWKGCVCKRCLMTRDCNHEWNGCTCVRCSKIRNQDHTWEGCLCVRCYRLKHNIVGCQCVNCRKFFHDWSYDSECKECGGTGYEAIYGASGNYHSCDECKGSGSAIDLDSRKCTKCGESGRE